MQNLIFDQSGKMATKPITTRLATLFICVSVLLTSGCAEDTDGRVPVEGTVNLGGSPIPQGTIEFHPKDPGGTHSGCMITDGKFAIPAIQGPKPGQYEVKIYVADPNQMVEPEPGLPGDSSRRPAAKQIVPAKYNSKSELTASIGEHGTKDLKFDLDTK